MFGLLSEFCWKAKTVARRRILRAGRRMAAARNLKLPSGFFDQYPLFYSTSQTAAVPNRLNQRYRACIEWNEQAIRGMRILDLACHDGRWSFAAMKAGATSVVGIEARDYLVEAASANMRKYRVPENSFRFIAGDVFEHLDHIEPQSIDTVFCLGFFYHQGDHMLLLSKIARLKPKYMILDTAITLDPKPIILLWSEKTEGEANAAPLPSHTSNFIVAGTPSTAGLELMLSNFGWSFEYFDWRRAGIRQWDDIGDYQEGWRVTLRVNCAP
jgi:2-polyprenyl-3-methyl-5-hydroxy-6-metoxy-1,4-benzoquinol methylase